MYYCPRLSPKEPRLIAHYPPLGVRLDPVCHYSPVITTRIYSPVAISSPYYPTLRFPLHPESNPPSAIILPFHVPHRLNSGSSPSHQLPQRIESPETNRKLGQLWAELPIVQTESVIEENTKSNVKENDSELKEMLEPLHPLPNYSTLISEESKFQEEMEPPTSPHLDFPVSTLRSHRVYTNREAPPYNPPVTSDPIIKGQQFKRKASVPLAGEFKDNIPVSPPLTPKKAATPRILSPKNKQRSLQHSVSQNRTLEKENTVNSVQQLDVFSLTERPEIAREGRNQCAKQNLDKGPQKFKMTYPDNSIYCGEAKDSVREGKGVLYLHDGTIYDGEWVNNKRTGFGCYYNKDQKLVYEGYWFENKFEGHGTFTYPEVDLKILPGKRAAKLDAMYFDLELLEEFIIKYEGGFKQNLREGYGTLYFANGAKFSGKFKADKAEGIGKFIPGSTADPGSAEIKGNWTSNKLTSYL